MTRQILSYTALALGEAIIITSFILFGKSLGTDVMVLDIVVSSIVYCSYFIDILVPWIRTNHKSDGRVGSIGVRWAATWTYSILAIAAMIILGNEHILPQPFTVQLLVQLGLLMLLLLGLVGAFASHDKVKEVADKEQHLLSHKQELISTATRLSNQAADSGIEGQWGERIEKLKEAMRFISPCNTAEALHLEAEMIRELEQIGILLNSSINEGDKIEMHLQKAERLLKERKQQQSK